jgi:hypothetical protein
MARKIKVKEHSRKIGGPRKPKVAMPGPHEFSADEEQAMRQGMRGQREPAAEPDLPNDNDGDETFA